MDEDPRPYSRQYAIKKVPVPPPLRKCSAFPHNIPSYCKRNVSSVVEKCGIEILGLLSVNHNKVKASKTISKEDLYKACISNGITRSEFNCYNNRKTGEIKNNLCKLAYAELLIKI